MKRMLFSILLLSVILAGCSNSITSKKAEEIAIQTAIDEGYSNPELFLEYDNKTQERYHYSKNDDKDIKVWEVSLITAERPREIGMQADLIYYINIGNGEVVDKISGIDWFIPMIATLRKQP